MDGEKKTSTKIGIKKIEKINAHLGFDCDLYLARFFITLNPVGKKPRNFIKELPYNSTIYVIFLTLSKTASLYSKAKRTASRIIDVRKSSYEY